MKEQIDTIEQQQPHTEDMDDMMVEALEGIEKLDDGTYIDGFGNTDSEVVKNLNDNRMKNKEQVFWYSDLSGRLPKLKVDMLKYVEWLERHGFAVLRDGKSHTSNHRPISFRGNLIDNENEDTIRIYTLNYFKDEPEDMFVDEDAYGVEREKGSNEFYTKDEVMRLLFNFSFQQNTYGFQTKAIWENYVYETLPMLLDKEKEVFLPFQNDKIVHITPHSIKIKDTNKIDKGKNVWKSQIIPHDITDDTGNKGLFEKFSERAISYSNRLPKNGEKWYDVYKIDEDVYKSLKTSYGYLISGYNHPSQPVAPIYIDGDAEIGMEEGRNGKSVIMSSIKYYKKTTYMSGQTYHGVTSSQGYAQFQGVELDTKFVFLNDTKDNFDMTDLYDKLSDDFEVSGKYMKKFVIPRNMKPKIGITTNHLPIIRGGSGRHRIHLTPFGNYWLSVRERNEEPKDKQHLGKLLFDTDFTKEDWNEFYHFGFRCVQLYLKEGLHKCNTDRQNVKGLIVKWEGDDRGLVRHIIDVILNNKIPELMVKPGLSQKEFHQKILSEIPDIQTKHEWNGELRKFNKMLFDICKVLGFRYNDHNSHYGDTPNKRKYVVKGEQHLVITK